MKWLIALFFFCSSANAASFFGALGGASFVGQGVGAEPTVGLEGAVDVASGLDVGIHFTWLNLTGSANETVLAPKLEYRLSDRVGPFFGVLTGLGINKHFNGTDSSVGFLAAPELGYRIALPTSFSAGVNVNWAFTTNSPNFLNVLLSVSYWLF